MAYAVRIETVCNWDICQRRATHEVRNRRNDVMGKYCQGCAERRVASLNASEATEDRKRPDA